jgi:hypothetical protein
MKQPHQLSITSCSLFWKRRSSRTTNSKRTLIACLLSSPVSHKSTNPSRLKSVPTLLLLRIWSLNPSLITLITPPRLLLHHHLLLLRHLQALTTTNPKKLLIQSTNLFCNTNPKTPFPCFYQPSSGSSDPEQVRKQTFSFLFQQEREKQQERRGGGGMI